MPDDVGARLAAFIVAGRSTALPDHVRERARLHILDTVVAAMACRELEPARLARAFAAAEGGSGSTILGSSAKAGMIEAAFAGAMTANAAEINDFLPAALVQPGPAVLATALAIAERRGTSGERLLRAVVTGYELAGRVPKALGLPTLSAAGLSSHAIGSLFGAAAAAASLLDLDPDGIAAMFAFAAEEAGGSMQWLLDVEHVEKTFVFGGRGARAGLTAALMAAQGWRGNRAALDAPGGWMRSAPFATPGQGERREALVAGLGDRFEMDDAAFKRFPVGGPTQPAIAGLLDLLQSLDRRRVVHLRIEMPGLADAFRAAQLPALNLRYTSALILIDGRLDFVAAQSRERFVHNTAVHAMMERVEVLHDPTQEPSAGQPREESARVTATLDDGTTRSIFVSRVLGYPSHPMTRADVEAKAAELLAPRSSRAIAAIVAAAGSSDRLPRAASLLELAAG